MTTAAVGFQCPECVAAGHAATRSARTMFGARSLNGAPVTMTLIVITVVCFLGQYVIGFSRSIEKFALIGFAAGSDFQPIGVAAGEYYRLLTAAFLHGGLLHIALNMYVLYILGPPLEQQLGRARYLLVYLASAIGGSVASYCFSAPNTPSVGASGAIFGLMGATLVVARAMKREVGGVLVLIGVNLALGFLIPTIDWRAHLGGLIAGAATAALAVYALRSRALMLVGVLGISGVVVLAVLLRTMALRGF